SCPSSASRCPCSVTAARRCSPSPCCFSWPSNSTRAAGRATVIEAVPPANIPHADSSTLSDTKICPTPVTIYRIFTYLCNKGESHKPTNVSKHEESNDCIRSAHRRHRRTHGLRQRKKECRYSGPRPDKHGPFGRTGYGLLPVRERRLDEKQPARGAVFALRHLRPS